MEAALLDHPLVLEAVVVGLPHARDGECVGAEVVVRPEVVPRASDLRDHCATNSTMASVGIRELRQRASELVRRVENGESIEITDRGRPVAVLAPLPDDPVQRLRAAGDLQPSEGDLDELPEPLALPADSEAPSRVLARLRRDER